MCIYKGKLSECMGYKCGVGDDRDESLVHHCCRLHSRAPQLIGDRRIISDTAGVTWTVH